MVYITVRQSPIYHQMSIDEFLFGNFSASDLLKNDNTVNTRTYVAERVNDRLLEKLDVDALINKLVSFNESVAYLREKDRKDLYRTFPIPKKSGGFRRIDAPVPELMDALRRLKTILEEDFHALYHTSAFAYVRKRCTIDAVKKHQANESRWFAKLDLHNFFGSTTLDYVMRMFSIIYPFSEVVKHPAGLQALRDALDLAFLNGVLPQGTPISPLITNVMMIPIDHKLSNTLRDFEKQNFVYTRYADDFIISSRYNFDIHKIEKLVADTLKSFDAPFSINGKKTRYGSSAGSNWNLGVMLNKDNEITVGNKNKRQFQAALHNYIMDRRAGIRWSYEDLRTLYGLHSYYKMVEGDTIDAIVKHINEKMEVDVLRMIKDDLK